MTIPSTILITASSGEIGSCLVPLLLSQSPQPKLVLPTTNAENVKSAFPSISQSEHDVVVPEGTVQDPLWFESLLKENKVDTVFLCLAGTDEMYTALNCLDGIAKAKTVEKVIYLSIIGDFTSDAGFKETVRTRAYPHLFSKVLVEQRLTHAAYDFEWTILGPTTFFSNDYMQKINVMQHSEMQDLSEHGVDKVALSGIALAACNAMYDTTGAWNRKKVQLGTRKAYTGAELIAMWSDALQKPIKAVYATEEGGQATELQLRAIMPGAAGKAVSRSIRLVYEYLMKAGMSMDEKEYEEQVKLLGREPEDYEPWVRKTAALWLRE